MQCRKTNGRLDVQRVRLRFEQFDILATCLFRDKRETESKRSVESLVRKPTQHQIEIYDSNKTCFDINIQQDSPSTQHYPCSCAKLFE